MGTTMTFAASQRPHGLNTVGTYRANTTAQALAPTHSPTTQKSMKFNLKTVSVGSLFALAMLIAPLSTVASAQAEGGRRGGHHLEQLDLSEAQTEQIEAIRADAREQIGDVLTSEQRATLENSEGRGRRAFRELDLSEDQRNEIRAIHEDSREQVNEILTPAQRQQVEEIRENHLERNGGQRGPRARRVQ
ncbi:MAG: hypothetical protein AAFP20_07590 [Cyanobacteria bacterium J06614_10]